MVFRYANCGGAKDYFIVRNNQEFEEVINKSYPKTSITVFFESNFKLKGLITNELCEKAIDLLHQETENYEGIGIINIDNEGILLDNDFYFSTPHEIQQYFSDNKGRLVFIGTLEFWKDNCESIITVYVPDSDGVVRPGAY